MTWARVPYGLGLTEGSLPLVLVERWQHGQNIDRIHPKALAETGLFK